MNANEFAAYGLKLAGWVRQSARNPNYEPRGAVDDEIFPEVLAQASALKARAERVQVLLSLPENARKISDGPLLPQATELPFDITSLSDNVIYFERLSEAVEEYLTSPQSWDEFLGANLPRLLALWEEPDRREKEDQEKLLGEKERLQEAFIQNLARAKASIPHPRRDAPCFATTAKNGLNCSRKTLVQILQLPPPLPPKKGEISAKRCTECWRIYKEFREVDASTHQGRSRFLQPGQSDPALGYDFSPSEASEFEKIDFAAILHPVLKSEPPIPLRSFMLYDMHPLHGGRALWALEGSRAIVQTVARYANRGGQLWENRKRIRWSARELAGVEQFAAERHFFSWAIAHRPGLPDEGSIVIEMVSKDGRRVRHQKWANTPHPDFDAIHQLLLQLSNSPGDYYYEGPMNWNWRPEGFS